MTVCPIVLRLKLAHPLGFDESTFEIPGDGSSLHAGRLGQQAHLAIRQVAGAVKQMCHGASHVIGSSDEKRSVGRAHQLVNPSLLGQALGDVETEIVTLSNYTQ